MEYLIIDDENILDEDALNEFEFKEKEDIIDIMLFNYDLRLVELEETPHRWRDLIFMKKLQEINREKHLLVLRKENSFTYKQIDEYEMQLMELNKISIYDRNYNMQYINKMKNISRKIYELKIDVGEIKIPKEIKEKHKSSCNTNDVYDRMKCSKRFTVDEKSTLRDVVNSHPYQIKKCYKEIIGEIIYQEKLERHWRVD